MISISNQELRATVKMIASAAASEILNVYNSNFKVFTKIDQSPVTAADKVANDLITRQLTQLTPDIPILSEESPEIAFADRQSWPQYWLVDPLDGTKEFVKRNGEFTVNIALIRDNAPVLGVVYVPVSGDCYSAAEGDGAFKSDKKGDEFSITARPLDMDAIIAVGSRSHNNKSTERFFARLGNVEIVSKGSSLKICYVAEGKVDVYPRFGPTSEWDTAAAQCIVEQAGGRLTDLCLDRLLYNTKESVLNPSFLVFGDSNHDWHRYIDIQP